VRLVINRRKCRSGSVVCAELWFQGHVITPSDAHPLVRDQKRVTLAALAACAAFTTVPEVLVGVTAIIVALLASMLVYLNLSGRAAHNSQAAREYFDVARKLADGAKRQTVEKRLAESIEKLARTDPDDFLGIA
jgi:hypothetical protein